ncbi:MAG: cell division protein ZapA [Oscillospiraceae bacterium]|nr:cell division protein ZapA [Oscillospiraceae bacterium]
MANRVTMSICGEDYTLVAEESPSYMERVGKLVDSRLREVLSSASVSRTDAAILAAINIADELLKAQENAENLRRQIKTYVDEAAQAKNEVSELKRQLFKAQNRR